VKKILFVNPSNRNDIFENVKILSLPPLNLAMLAAVASDLYEVTIVDEVKEEINFATAAKAA
jgi:hypothetical protein